MKKTMAQLEGLWHDLKDYNKAGGFMAQLE